MIGYWERGPRFISVSERPRGAKHVIGRLHSYCLRLFANISNILY